MDALGLFVERYDAIHHRFVGDLFAGLADAQVRARPSGVNSIAWLVWHLARVQDAAVNRLVADGPQVLDEGRWNAAMGTDRRDVGSGMTSAEVDALSARIDLEALRGYHGAVAARVRDVATGLPAPAWDAIVAPERVRRVCADEGLLLEAARWVEEFWARGHTRGWYLLQVAVLHPYGHCFEGTVTRGLLGVPDR